jgi:hypothetical protein
VVVVTMATLKLKPIEQDLVQTKLMEGHYDKLLEEFRVKLDEATAALKQCHEAMRAANTLRS